MYVCIPQREGCRPLKSSMPSTRMRVGVAALPGFLLHTYAYMYVLCQQIKLLISYISNYSQYAKLASIECVDASTHSMILSTHSITLDARVDKPLPKRLPASNAACVKRGPLNTALDAPYKHIHTRQTSTLDRGTICSIAVILTLLRRRLADEHNGGSKVGIWWCCYSLGDHRSPHKTFEPRRAHDDKRIA